MSILIKGMEMPTTCGNCPIHKLWAEDDEAQCMIKRELWTKYSKRNPDCPLIEVPDGHGRLIDADAVERNLVKMQMAQKSVVGHGIRKSRAVVRDMATIIPADKDGEEDV